MNVEREEKETIARTPNAENTVTIEPENSKGR